MRHRFTFLCITLAVALVFLTLAKAGRFQAAGAVSHKRANVQAAPDKPERKHTGSVIAVVNDKAGKPVEGASVELKDTVTKERTSLKSDKDGKCTFSKLFPGTYDIQASKGEMEASFRGLKVSNGRITNRELVLRPKK